MKKYYIGLLALGILTLGLTMYVITIGLQSSQDVKTEKFANSAATTLGSYITRNQEIPASLSATGITNIPSTVTYNKLSEKQYKFCVNYKADKGYGSGDITNVVTGTLMSQMYSGYDDSSGSKAPETSLYLNYSHKKGEECHTVEPYIAKTSSFDDYCSSYSKTSSYYKMYCAPSTINYSTN